ncbi:protein rolling stone-like [Mizuhopecten yessoensis]|uniref:Protein rolling stone n=1 Tax=Mizuhopecten yessoensis TaxID=6573 RepID=A0A210PDS6_MIZYE|nr:protein rolling stone-like [Mizuhopecten yessoensis]OWF34648.1 Protein rolling stone [Mizuhopecten yessoensis]
MPSCCQHVRREFELMNLGFGGVRPNDFTRFHFPWPPLLYVVYRVALALYALFWLLVTGMEFTAKTAHNDRIHSWPVYLSHWAYLILTLYLLLYALAVSFHVCRRPKYFWRVPSSDTKTDVSQEHTNGTLLTEATRSSEVSPELNNTEHPLVSIQPPKEKTLQWYFKVTWALYGVVSNAAAMVTLVFFLYLWPKMSYNEGVSNMNLQTHAINFVIVGLDHVLGPIPVRMLHALYSVILGLIYLLFTLVLLWTGDVRPIYPFILDWANEWRTSLVTSALLVVLGIPLIHTFFFVMFKIKECISTKVKHCLAERELLKRIRKEPVTVL